MSLVVTRLAGGLGNQMFQYAIGRAIALRCNARLKLDVSEFGRGGNRKFDLGCFGIVAGLASPDEISRFKRKDRLHKALRFVWPAVNARSGYYRERRFEFDPATQRLEPPLYLSGYWQSERYFSDYAGVLRREFQPIEPIGPENAVIAGEIDAVRSVSLHLRRGDYVSDARTANYHGSCTLEYYRHAIACLKARLGQIHLFAFSDDPDWIRHNLHVDLPMRVVDVNPPDRSYRDMQLMSRCCHHIIANSSFSWWAAWLNPSPAKLVLAPKRWFNMDAIDTRDLLPGGWIRI